MNNKPQVSILMPAFQCEKYVAISIESILCQTFQDFEFIIIDDCSSDKTWEIIKHYARKDPRIQAIQNDKNLGIAGNRNKLIALAQGEFIAWQDADDISCADRIAKQCEFLHNHPEVGIVGGYLQFFSEAGNAGVRKYATEDGQLRKRIYRYSPVAQPASMIRKICFEEFGEYDLRYPPAEDIDMSFRIGQKYRFANLPQIVLKYREHPGSATYTKLRKIELNTLEIRMKYFIKRSYKATVLDLVYNVAQFMSIFLVPPRFKIQLFNYFRNAK
jgi:glycosyltransferase involved in cell wall biosynthesis